MGVSISLEVVQPVEVFSANYTHNVIPMAKEAGIYELVWHPDLFLGLDPFMHRLGIVDPQIAKSSALLRNVQS